MSPQDDDTLSALGKARERLYDPDIERSSLDSPLSPRSNSTIPRRWRERPRLTPLGAPHHLRFASRFFFIALGFFVIAVGISALLFYTGSNTVSVDDIELTIQGPTTVAGGDTVPLSISIANKNPTTAEEVVLDIDFPPGTRSALDLSQPYTRYSDALGSLAPGGQVERTVSAVLFGSEGAKPTIEIAVSFSTSRSSSVFVKRLTYPIVISTAPLSISLDAVTETISGKPFTIRATVRSNATQAIDSVILKAQYPAGYLLADSSITPVGMNFSIGTLAPGASRVVTLTGTLTGQDNDERVFHFTVGTAKAVNDPALAVAYMTQETQIRVAAPFLVTSFIVNGSSVATPAVAPGAPVTVRVSWSNALAVPLANAVIEVGISGAALDPASVEVQKGFYRSADRTVIFSRDTDQALATLAPGATGFGTFSFATLASAPRNSALTLTVSVAGERVGQSGVPERITASANKTIRLVSAVTFTTSSSYAPGPFANSGPVPPVAEEETSYTVTWGIVNTGNDLADAAVTALLPSYVTFPGVTLPADGSISFDGASRKVTWRIGDMAGGASRQGSFRVIVTPSTSQRGMAPLLTTVPSFSAYDRYAEVQVTTTGEAVSTETPGDPGYTANKATVQ